MCAARAGLDVGEYAARLVKKAVVGNGNAEKVQVHAMVIAAAAGREDRRARCRRCAGGRDHPRAPSSARAQAGLSICFEDTQCARVRGNDRETFRNPCRNQRRRRGDRRRRRRLSGARSGRTLDAIGPVGGEVLLLTELQVREDAWTLFGFGSAVERDSFRALTSVQGVGRPAGAGDPLGPVARRAGPRRRPGRQGDDRPRQRRRPQARRALRQ